MKAEWKNLDNLALEILKEAKQMGADAAEVGISEGSGLTASVRLGEVETVEFHQDKNLEITVYKGKKKGSVSSCDVHREAIQSVLEAACRIAEYTEEDPYAGLADRERLASKILDCDLYHPWEVSAEEAISWTKECEASARAFDTRIVNSEGATFSTHQDYRVYANTQGFIGAYPTSRYGLSCTVIAKHQDSMQRDYDFTVARDGRDLEARVAIGQKAALRSLRRLNARKIKTCEAPVIFEARIAPGLLGSFITAISGGNLYRKSSFLLDHLDKAVFPPFVQIKEMPHLLKGLGSAPFDQEGVQTTERVIVDKGILKSYVLSSYSARKLGLKTTGNSGGVHNLIISHTDHDLPALLQEMGTGFLVTELIGQGPNIVTGDYSRGAAGFWVEKGEIQFPVEEVTIAGNLKEMFANIVAIGDDVEKRSNILTGSLWINRMTIAGS